MVLVAAAAVEDGLLPVLLEGGVVGAAAALGSATPLAPVQAAAMAAAAADSALAALRRRTAAAMVERAEARAELAAAAAARAGALRTPHHLRAATLLTGVVTPQLPSAVAKEAAAARNALAKADVEAEPDGALILIHVNVSLEGAAAQASALTMLLAPAQMAVPLLSCTVTVMLADVVPDSGPSLALLAHGWKLVAAQAARLREGRAQWRAPC